MTNQQTLARAQIVEQLLDQNGVDVEHFRVSSDGQMTLTVDLADCAIDAASTPIDPSRVGGGTIKTLDEE